MKTPLRVEVTRGGHLESAHLASAVLADAEGRVLQSWGDPGVHAVFRSSAKPFQALPLLETGAAEAFGLTQEEVAQCVASHTGLPFHTQMVAGILAKARLQPSQLQCRPHPGAHGGLTLPPQVLQVGDMSTTTGKYRRATPEEALFICNKEIADPEETKGALVHNCSGKHAGMLLASQHNGWPLVRYRDPEGPLQQYILQCFSNVLGVAHSEIRGRVAADNCGAPIIPLSLTSFARAYAQWGAGSGQHGKALLRSRDAVWAYPERVSGPGHFEERLNTLGRGRWVVKGGAEAVFGLGFADGRGLAVKIHDGSERAMPPVVLSILKELGETVTLDPVLWGPELVIRNFHGMPCGELRVRK
ncbi:MAG: asparaginase [Planctomycetota bacterium]